MSIFCHRFGDILSMYKKIVLVSMLLGYPIFLTCNDDVVVYLRRMLTQSYSLDSSNIDLFVSNCKWALLDDAQLAIVEALSLQNSDDNLILLQDLKVKLQCEIQAIHSQIKNKHKFDNASLKKAIIATGVLSFLSYCTYKCYHDWLLSAQKNFENIASEVKDRGIQKVVTYKYCGSSTITTTNFYKPGCKYLDEYVELQDLCKKYLNLEKANNNASFCTYSLGVISIASLLYALHSYYNVATIDPDQNNNYLAHYQKLLDFVILVQKEYKVRVDMLLHNESCKIHPIEQFIDEFNSVDSREVFDEELQLSLIATIEKQQIKNMVDGQKSCINFNFMINSHNGSVSKTELYLQKLKFDNKLLRKDDLVANAYMYYKYHQKSIPNVENIDLLDAGKYGLFWCHHGECYSNELFKTKFYLSKGLFHSPFLGDSSKEIDELYKKYLNISAFQLLPNKKIADVSCVVGSCFGILSQDNEVVALCEYLKNNPVKFLQESKNCDIAKIKKIIKEVINEVLYRFEAFDVIQKVVQILLSLQKVLEEKIIIMQKSEKRLRDKQDDVNDQFPLQRYQELLVFVMEMKKQFNIL